METLLLLCSTHTLAGWRKPVGWNPAHPAQARTRENTHLTTILTDYKQKQPPQFKTCCKRKYSKH